MLDLIVIVQYNSNDLFFIVQFLILNFLISYRCHLLVKETENVGVERYMTPLFYIIDFNNNYSLVKAPAEVL